MADDNQLRDLKAFDDSKAGVKGLVDSGIERIPPIFVHDKAKLEEDYSICHNSQSKVPGIDFDDINTNRAQNIVKNRDDREKWGFFQVINHEIPARVINRMIDGVGRFHEQEAELKKQYFTRDQTQKFMYFSNFDLYQAWAANWRDTISCLLAPDSPKDKDLPPVCRDIMYEYTKYVVKFGHTLFELLSESLDLDRGHLNSMGCAEGVLMVGQYYPSCPEPELTYTISKHMDSGFLTVLIQD
ncbi:Deacetoxyvindoline 4-hydroxylase [Handroanthus impetiginosus]|uniref:Deacetoxyvindoline 4-hydroxylase n=1 Tax=Handroanthus impetiginosus TaxID=429701 RepID=A0A2G9IAM6_9LAMI|nr:Deacetoxyvindoline 4-hydroxylase [Handroanthus impetiginosus]